MRRGEGCLRGERGAETVVTVVKRAGGMWRSRYLGHRRMEGAEISRREVRVGGNTS